MPSKINHVWYTRSKEVDFLRNNGGFYAVTLTLDLEQAGKLLEDVRACINTAKRYGKDEIQIIPHWGKKGGTAGDVSSGYLLRTRVRTD